jgi:uncharacterized membrane protein YjgN (DUF898 family)
MSKIAESETVAAFAVNSSPQPVVPPSELILEFKGSAREYFRIWVVNLCLTLLSFGIFSAWAKVRRKRYFYSSTTIGGTPFQYLGQPIPIFKGRLIIAAGFLFYYASMNIMTSLIPYFLCVALVAAPWVLVRSSAFNSRYSAFRNMTFHFDGGYLDAAKVLYMWGLIPAIVIPFSMAVIFGRPGAMRFLGIPVLFLIFIYPCYVRGIKKFIISHTSYGGIKGVFSATPGEVWVVYFVAGMIFTGFSIFSNTTTIALRAAKSEAATYINVILMYASVLIPLIYIKSRYENLVWNNTRIGPICFQSTLTAMGLLGLYLVNFLAIIGSLGLLIPWAVIRTMKYRADHMHLSQQGTLAEFHGCEMTDVTAVGAETMDLFDLDLSL